MYRNILKYNITSNKLIKKALKEAEDIASGKVKVKSCNNMYKMLEDLKNDNYFRDYDYDTTLDKLVELFTDVNALHPFRETNGSWR